MAQILRRLGWIAYRETDWDLADGYYRQASNCFASQGDRHRVAALFCDRANVALACSRLREVKRYYKQAHAFFVEFGDQGGRGTVHQNRATIARKQGKPKLAWKHARRVRKIFSDLANRYELAAANLTLATVAAKRRRWDLALKYHLAALAGFDPLLHNAARNRTIWASARIWQKSGDDPVPGKVAGLLGQERGRSKDAAAGLSVAFDGLLRAAYTGRVCVA